MRRTSSSSARPPTGIHRHGSVASVPSSGPSAPVTFPRPAYLDNSALRDRLQTEQYTALPQRRTLERAAPTDTRAHVRAYGAMSPFSDSDDDSTASLSRSEYGYIGGRSTTTAKPPAPPIIPADEVLKLPSRWSEQMRHPLLTVSPDGRDLSYEGVSCSGDRDAAAARTINPIPPACGIYYYEVTILSKGQKGHISIGFTGKDVKLARLPGWEPHSWGYHGDDGCSFAAEKSGTPYGPVFGTGDVIGCGIDFTINRAFYTKNGSFIGHVFDNIGKTCALYPSVGLRHAGEMVRVNFGHEAFRFDIEYHVQQQKAAVWGRIVGTAVDAGVLVRGVKQEAMGIKQEAAERDVRGIERDVRGIEQGIKQEAAEGDVRGALQGLVMSYLAHHGYARTTRALRTQAAGKVGEGAVGGASVGAGASAKPDADMHVGTGSEYVGTGSEYVGTDTDTDVEAANTDIEDADIARRTAIVGAVTAGDIDRAIAQTRAHYGAVLEDEDGLMLFKLRCRRFVEMVLGAGEVRKAGEVREAAGAGSVMDGRGMDGGRSMDGGRAMEEEDDEDDEMDVDDAVMSTSVNGSGSSTTEPPSSAYGPPPSAYEPPPSAHERALQAALQYGRALWNDYKYDTRPEVRALSERTFGIVAFDDPLEAGGITAETAGHGARVALGNELNQAILKSQGYPERPPLEMLFRQVSACVQELGLLGVGEAAFADVSGEFLEA